MRSDGKRPGIVRNAAALLSPGAAFLFLVFLSADVRADGVTGYVDYVYARTETKTSDAAGVESRSDFDTFLQRYSLTLDKSFYPNLKLLTGGLFEKNISNGSTETGAVKEDFDSSASKLRPFVDLRLATPPYQAAAVYSRSEDTRKSQGSPPLVVIRDQYAGTLGWNPQDFPSLRFQYFRSDNHDRERVLQDVTNQTYQFTSQYRPVSAVSLYYQGNIADSQNRLNNTETRALSHSGRIGYGDQFWNRRISVGANYNVSYRETEIRAGAGQEVSVPLAPLAGLSAIDDTPEQGTLVPNPALIDGDLQAGSGIGLGFQAGDNRIRNIGLDFGVQTTVNTLFVWIDRELPANVAASFEWTVYTSSDNLNWIIHPQTGAPAPLDPFVPRFEIRFADVSARFIKVVTRPLAAGDPLATQFPLIQVTELQSALRSPAASAQRKTSSVSHTYNLSVRTRILNVPTLAHELSYSATTTSDSPTRWTLSNGLFASHHFSRTVSGVARMAREDSQDAQQARTGYLLTVSLEAVPLPTLRHNLVFSGRTDSTEGRDSRNVSLFLYNTAALYKGVDANLAVSGSRNVTETGQTTDSIQSDASVSIVPHRKVTMSMMYSNRRDASDGGDLPAERIITSRTTEGSIAITPVNAVYFTTSYRVEDASDQVRRSIKNYSASWTPFPDGKLHLSFLYNETIRSETNGRERTISPNLRLDIGRGSFFTLAYLDTSSRSDILNSKSNTVSANLRIAF